MSTPRGRWIEFRMPDGQVRRDWIPEEQPPGPDGGPGVWHIVTDVPGVDGRWEWHPSAVGPMQYGGAPRPTQPPPGPGAWGSTPASRGWNSTPPASASPNTSKPLSGGDGAGTKAWRKFRGLPGALQAAAVVALVVLLGVTAALGSASDDATSVAQTSSKSAPTPVPTEVKAEADANCVSAFKEAGSYDIFGKARDIVRDIGDGKANLGDYSQLKAYAAKAEQIGKSKAGKRCADPELKAILDNGITATVTMSELAVYASHDQIDQFSDVLRRADLKADAAFYDLL